MTSKIPAPAQKDSLVSILAEQYFQESPKDVPSESSSSSSSSLEQENNDVSESINTDRSYMLSVLETALLIADDITFDEDSVCLNVNETPSSLTLAPQKCFEKFGAPQ
mmetsp:Transcript_13868/g.18165  ORF Transcript_13868/g.18165 Transcript_13868/m.18165 type:complete len:108 (-) Transcript_13868:96-419(-)